MTFETDGNKNTSFWLEMDAALGKKSYGFGVYTANSKDSKAAVASAQPAAIKPAYSPDGEYEVRTSWPLRAVMSINPQASLPCQCRLCCQQLGCA